MTALVRARGLTKAYGRADPVLHGVDLDVEQGRVTAVTGPSGSGKSTLVHCLAGLTRPDAGTVHLGDHELTAGSDSQRAELRRSRMAFVLQRRNLLPDLTALENVALPLLMQRLPRDTVQARADEALERVGLGSSASALPARLSGGQAQRVAVARALCARPEVVWADEPTGALDSAAAATVVAALRLLADDGVTVVVVTHDEPTAAAADVVVRLRGGRITP